MTLTTTWSYDEVLGKRDRFMSPSLRTFTAYERSLVLKKGQGQYLWDEAGKKYLDCLAQNLCISIGYNHPKVTKAAIDQLTTLQHATTMYYHPVPAHLAEELVARLPANEDWVVHFVNSGAEAVDLALLMARLHTGSQDLIALNNAYHGLHFSAMAATGLSICRQPAPGMPGIHHVEHPDQYRGVWGEGVGRYVEAIERLIGFSTTGRIAGFLAEPIQGFGGVVPLPAGYLPKAFELVRNAGGLCIIDEVQTGFARMGSHYWGFEAHAVVPDIIVMGKGIGNGFPLAAVVARREIAESMAHKKFFNTYGSNPTACAAGRAVLAAIDEDGIRENARLVGGLMMSGLERLKQRHDVIGDVRGRGLMLGVELVKDRRTKEPALEETIRVHEIAKQNGLIMGRGGTHGNVLRINPPMCLTAEDAALFEESLDASFRAL